MNQVKVLIVEDDFFIAEGLESALKEFGYRVTAIANSCESTLESIRKNPPDIVIMDISIQGNEDGIDTAKQIEKVESYPIIYLTNLSDPHTLKRAKNTRHSGFLAKPFTPHQLRASIELAIISTAESNEDPRSFMDDTGSVFSTNGNLFVRDNIGNYRKTSVDDILFIGADRAYCTIHTKTGEFVLSNNMSRIWTKIGKEHLVQVSRSHVVNIENIDRIKGNIVVIGEHELKIGTQFKEQFLQELNLVK